MQYKYTFTVFTPTYNRAHTLHRPFKSLMAQTFRDFEWVIIDDGSSDNTKDVIDRLHAEADFPIRYVFQENQGKPMAFNKAVQLSEGELFLNLDSDDEFMPTALERFKYHWDNIPYAERSNFSAVTALCMDQYGNRVGDRFPSDVIDSDYLEICYKYKVKGEKCGFHRTEVLRDHPFLNYNGFVPEGIVWSAIARKYKSRCINEVLRIYYINDSVSSDQLTKAHPSRHASGHALWHRSILNDELNWFAFAPFEFFRSATHYSRFSFHAKISLYQQARALNHKAKLLWLLCLPLGLLVFLKDLQS